MRSVIAVFITAILFCSQAVANNTVEFVQSALSELGYDPGPVDGAWGGKTRKALNELREANGLIAQKDLSGSSLYLLHRLAPSDATLPNPGLLMVDFSDRRKWLSQNRYVAQRHCNTKHAEKYLDSDWQPQRRYSLIAKDVKRGFVSTEWDVDYTNTAGHYALKCMSGINSSCEAGMDLARQWASSPKNLDGRHSPRNDKVQFEDEAYLANNILIANIVSLAMYVDLNDIPLSEFASVLDWQYAKAKRYNFLSLNNRKIGAIDNKKTSNHAMFAELPTLMLASFIGDKTMFESGLGPYKDILSSVREDGSLPVETRRGARALHYQNYTVGMLVLTAELADSQGYDLYSWKTDSGRGILDVAKFATWGFGDWNGRVFKYAKVNKSAPRDPSMPDLKGLLDYASWMPTFASRFPDAKAIEIAKSKPLDPMICTAKHVEGGWATEHQCKRIKPGISTLENALQPGGERASLFNGALPVPFACLTSKSSKLFD